ncbi:uncharacterized protein LOC131440375 [Malaya genurostris]|uniref:uncharacterized protein LOC131440375 n=1 Tax=Malaya genurostris TaxID=325434 RepID=UPI0026F3B838|nr:uncharacterized protein LOC131440375 [Malaya genurostris]
MSGTQILLGNVAIMAHRKQIRRYKDRDPEPRPNMMMGPSSEADRFGILEREESLYGAGSGSEENLFRGFSEHDLAKVGRKRKASTANLPGGCLRRSKRLRKQTENPDFYYDR